MSNFRTIDRQTGSLLPPSVDKRLPEKHLARFVVEVIDGLELRAMSGDYRGSGSASYHPRILLSFWLPAVWPTKDENSRSSGDPLEGMRRTPRRCLKGQPDANTLDR